MIMAIKESFKLLNTWLGKERALLNIVISDGIEVIATSHAINGLCPTLYYGKNIKSFPKNSQLLASEPLTDDQHWQAITAHTLLRLRPDAPLEEQKL